MEYRLLRIEEREFVPAVQLKNRISLQFSILHPKQESHAAATAELGESAERDVTRRCDWWVHYTACAMSTRGLCGRLLSA